MPHIATEKWPPKVVFGGQRYKPGDPVPAEHARTARILLDRGWLEVVETAEPPRTEVTVDPRAIRVRSILAEAGYDTPERIAAATDEELVALKGIGVATVKQLRAGEL